MRPKPTPKPHTAGIASSLTTLLGLAGAVVANPPHGWQGWAALGIAAVGSVLQAATKPVTAGETDLVPKGL